MSIISSQKTTKSEKMPSIFCFFFWLYLALSFFSSSGLKTKIFVLVHYGLVGGGARGHSEEASGCNFFCFDQIKEKKYNKIV